MTLKPRDERAASITLEGAGAARVALSDYWNDRPTVLVFLRHFG